MNVATNRLFELQCVLLYIMFVCGGNAEKYGGS